MLSPEGPNGDISAKFCLLSSTGYSGSDIRLSFGSVLTLIVIWKVFFPTASACNTHIWNVSWNQELGGGFELNFSISLFSESLDLFISARMTK